MKKKQFLPKGNEKRELWLTNFAIEFEAVGLTLGFTAAEITEVTNCAAAFTHAMKVSNLLKWECQEWNKYKALLADGDIGTHLGPFPTIPTIATTPTTVPAGIFKNISKVVQRIKHHPNYDEAMGKNLGIIGPVEVIDNETAKVVFNVRGADNDGVVLDFVKGYHYAVIVYVALEPEKGDEEGTLNWQEVGRTVTSPFVDKTMNKTKKAEKRYYRMRYLDKEIPVGLMSDAVIVTSTTGTDVIDET